jgi:hypothetical protein
MAGTIICDRIESDASFPSSINIASPIIVSNTFAIPAGSVGAPALSPVGDTNTGIYFPAADAIGISTNGVDRIRVTSAGNVGIGTNSPQRKFDVTVNDTTTAQLYVRNNSASHASGLVVFTDTGQASMFRHNGSSDNSLGGANSLNIGTITNNNFAFITNDTERLRIDSSGNLLVGTTTAVTTNVAGVMFARVGTQGRMTIGSTSTAAQDIAYFFNPNGIVGSIQTSGSSTSYVTSSDYRLKHDIQPMTGALAKVQQLKPVTYKWNADDSESQGFIAHELQEVVPECVTGEKDAVDKDGKPVYQGIDTSFLVATLTAAIKEQQTIIEELKARLDAANL